VIHADISSSSADDQNDVEVSPAPTDILRDFQQYQAMKRQYELTHHPPHPVDARTAVVPGIAGHYAMLHGMQYYRDLAGNIKQVSSCSIPC